MTCAKHKIEPARGYSECAGCEVERLTADYMAHERMIAGYDATIIHLRAENDRMREALEKLARLGNGSEYGNSDGNMIARIALSRAEQAKLEQETFSGCNKPHECFALRETQRKLAELRRAAERVLNRMDSTGEWTKVEANMLRAASSDVKQAEPETCKWTWGPILGWQSQCKGMIQDCGQAPDICTSCGGRVEAWDVDGKRVEVKK